MPPLPSWLDIRTILDLIGHSHSLQGGYWLQQCRACLWYYTTCSRGISFSSLSSCARYSILCCNIAVDHTVDQSHSSSLTLTSFSSSWCSFLKHTCLCTPWCSSYIITGPYKIIKRENKSFKLSLMGDMSRSQLIVSSQHFLILSHVSQIH